ncbi:MAG: zinc ribbon domain-containing protein [Candidatus Aureabacteria bacterium]|nr:zinc ribbon domain-containing protein [Candidatus Auribacterota bacterium]
MPIYEYACDRCRKVFNFLVRNVSSHKAPKCPRCGKGGMKRRVSSFRIGRSDDARMEKLADPSSLAGLDEKDPRSLARWMKKMGREIGEEMPEEMNDMADRLETGESPEEIERSMGEGGYTKDDSGELYEA